jgi:hypothetical protein
MSSGRLVKGGKPKIEHNKVADEVALLNADSLEEKKTLHAKHTNKELAKYKAIRIVSIDGMQKNGDFRITVDGRAGDFIDWEDYEQRNAGRIVMSKSECRKYKSENNSVTVPASFLKDADKKKPKVAMPHDFKVGAIVYVHNTSEVYDQTFIGLFTPKIEKEWRDAGLLVD